jgi:hypothetical protein
MGKQRRGEGEGTKEHFRRWTLDRLNEHALAAPLSQAS